MVGPMTATTAGYRPELVSIQIVRAFDESPDTSYLEQDGWEEERAQYEAGEWFYIGLYARAFVTFRTPQGGSAGGFHVRSCGLWGIESHSGSDYLKDIAEEELSELKDLLEPLGFTADMVDALEVEEVEG